MLTIAYSVFGAVSAYAQSSEPANAQAGSQAITQAASQAASRAVSQAVSQTSQTAQQADVPAPDSAEAFYQRAATCAAAMEIDQLALVARARRGTPGLRPAILELTTLGFTYVGIAYEKGLRNPRADEMLKASRAAQKSWSPAHHASVAGECHREAQELYDHTNAMEKWLVNKRAGSRTDRFLSSPAHPSSIPGSAASR